MSYTQDGHGFFTRALDAEDRGRLDEAETAYQQAIVLFRRRATPSRSRPPATTTWAISTWG